MKCRRDQFQSQKEFPYLFSPRGLCAVRTGGSRRRDRVQNRREVTRGEQSGAKRTSHRTYDRRGVEQSSDGYHRRSKCAPAEHRMTDYEHCLTSIWSFSACSLSSLAMSS